jgi:threonine dehydrogenase-like Zn-dependent dehydrogenase
MATDPTDCQHILTTLFAQRDHYEDAWTQTGRGPKSETMCRCPLRAVQDAIVAVEAATIRRNDLHILNEGNPEVAAGAGIV